MCTTLLTVAIPTYNRIECLRLLLQRLSQELAVSSDLRAKVEIYVLDNCSADGTKEYIDAAADDAIYFAKRNERNIGADGNIVDAFSVGKGRYVWVIGDDDLPKIGSLALIIELLERHKPNLVYLPCQWERGDLQNFAQCTAQKGVKVARSPYSLALQANAHVTFITSWIIDRENYLKFPAALPGRLVGSNLCQLEWILRSLEFGQQFVWSQTSWIVARGGNSGGYSALEIFSARYNDCIARIVRDPLLSKILRNGMLYRFLPGLIYSIRNTTAGHFDTKHGSFSIENLSKEYPRNRLFLGLLSSIHSRPLKEARLWTRIAGVLGFMWLNLSKVYHQLIHKNSPIPQDL